MLISSVMLIVTSYHRRNFPEGNVSVAEASLVPLTYKLGKP